MAFGFQVTLGTVIATGTYGKVVRFNLANFEPRTVTQIQMAETDPSPVMGDPVTAAVTLATLYAYLEDADAPDVAFAQSGNTVDVFLLATAYTVASTEYIGFWFQRNAVNVETTADKLDIPQESRSLVKAVALNMVYVDKGKAAPYQVTETINSEKAKLGL